VKVEAGLYTWKLALNSWGYGDAQVPVKHASPEYKANRVTYMRGAVREWYLNGPFGLEQGFTLDRPPARNPTGGPLTLSLALGGELQATVDTSGQGLVLSDPGSAEVLRYAGLSAYDAVGRDLPAKLDLRGKALLLQVNDAGARYPLTIDPFVQKAKLSVSDKAVGDYLGFSVSISGDVVVVGARYADPGGTGDAGAAYVFVKPGGGWAGMTQTARLTASDKAASDSFGYSVSISGDVVVVGAHYADPGGTNAAGAAYVFIKPGGGWADMTQTAKLTASDKAAEDQFGFSVSISGDVVVVGAYYADPGGTSNAGASYVFVKPGGGWTDMTQTARLTASDKAAGDYFGFSVSISGDVVVVGALYADPGGTSNAGASYVFVKPGGGWADMTQTARLTASYKAAGDEFGFSVSISADVVVVGAPYADPGGTGSAGAAYVFAKPGGGWADMTQTARLTASDKAAGDYFGYSVAVSGDVVVVGALFADPGGTGDAGASYIFAEPGVGWANMTQTAKLTASDKAVEDYFGFSVSIIGDVVVVGAILADPGGTSNAGTAYVFVNCDSTTTTITSDSPDPSLVGGTVNVSVTVSGGITSPIGTVDITGADTNCSISLSGGSGNCNVTFDTVGSKTLTATYNGDSTHVGSSDTEDHTVKANTTTTIVVDTPDPSAINQVVTVGATVTGGPTTPTGTVSISGADVNCVITLSAGSGTCNAIFTSGGAKILMATYNGDATHVDSSDTEDHAVIANTTTTITSDAPDPSADGQNVTVNYTVTVNSPGSGTPTGDVTVSDGVDSCSASVAAGSCTLALNTVGTRSLTATYPGDTDFNGSSDTENHKVETNTTTTIVADTPDPSALNQMVTVGATVTGGPTKPTGTVSITGANVNCVITLSAGSGTCNAIFSSGRAKILLATYNGDATHAGSSDTESHQVNPMSAIFNSAAAYDGWVLESSETSGLGGSINASETTFRLGDDASDRQYRSILSFNTAILPDNAVITSIVLKIKKQGLVGTDPFTTHQGLLVDIRKPYFGTALGLVASDFQASAGRSNVGTFGTTPSAGWYSVTLNSTARPYINKSGTTQFRLRFKLDDDNDNLADYLKFYSGNAGTASRPVLIIQYYMPLLASFS